MGQIDSGSPYTYIPTLAGFPCVAMMLDVHSQLPAGTKDAGSRGRGTQGQAKRKRAELIEALRGRIRPHHQRCSSRIRSSVEALQQAIAEIDAPILYYELDFTNTAEYL